MKAKHSLKNQGFTLVEMIITIAISTIVGGAILSFLVVSQKNYNISSAETELQYSTQLIVNHLQELLIDSSKGISYEYSGTLANGEETDVEGFLEEDSDLKDTNVLTKQLYIYDTEYYYVIQWDIENSLLRYSEYKADDTKTLVGQEVLADNITFFSVDLSKVLSSRIVKVEITLTKPSTNRSYTTNHTIKLRNDIKVNIGDLTEIYIPTPSEVVADRITAAPDSIFLWPGESVELSSIVNSVSGDRPSQDVAWDFSTGSEPTDKNNTKIVGGKVLLGNEEEGVSISGVESRLNIVAKQGSIESNPVQVYIRQLKDIKVTDNVGSLILENGAIGVSIEAVFEGKNITGLNTKDLGGVSIDVKMELDGKITDEVSKFIKIKNHPNEEGKIIFDVNHDIDFWAYNNPPKVNITFTANRENFTDVKKTISFTIQKSTLNLITETEWKRMDYLTLDLEELLTEDDVSEKDNINKIKLEFDFNGNKFQYKPYLQFDDIKYENNKSNYVDDSITGMKKMKLCGEIEVYHKIDTNKYFLKLIVGNESRIPLTEELELAKIHIKIDRGEDVESLLITEEVEVNPVKFEFKLATDDNTINYGGKWSTNAKNESITQLQGYLCKSKDVIFKVYYRLLGGWNENDTEYDIDLGNFIYYIDDVVDNGSSIEVSKKKNEKGESYLEFKIPKDRYLSSVREINTIEVKYQRQHQFDYVACEGTIVFNVMDMKTNISNIVEPSISYCPTPAQLNLLGFDNLLNNGYGYYYLNDNERFLIRKVIGPSYTIMLQKKENETLFGGDKIWKDKWTKRLSYNDNLSIWK